MIVIEIKGVGSHNKGAEMMLLTILQELSDCKKDIKFTVAPQLGSCEYSFYSKLGIFPKVWLMYKGLQFGYLGKYLPKKLRDIYGLITDDEVDIILDASGFAYSDQWGEYPAKVMANYSKRWKRKGKKIILMPQAFGPFRIKNIRIHMKSIIENADLIYARDEFSYNSLIEIVNDKKKIKLAPDFTVLLKKEVKPEYFNPEIHQICIVPNQRMIDKTGFSEQYLKIMVNAISYVINNNLSPFFLIFGGEEDLNLAKRINLKLSKPIPIVFEKDPVYIKGIIENTLGLIGSRFHSICTALYSGIVTFGIGWSYKYEYLFKDFGFPEGLLSLDDIDETLYQKLNILIDAENREFIRNRLAMKAKEQAEESKKMFGEVKKTMGLC